ncbi:MAG: hypothetical protein ABSF58_09350 [Solirubrobacteraceae bacterium]|jgi:hypothetical protein
MNLAANDASRSAARAEAEAAVAVAERGLESWRQAKAEWLASFSAFVAAEATSAPTALAGAGRAG